MTTRTICGTVSGYRRHIKRQETTCESCRKAWRENKALTRPSRATGRRAFPHDDAIDTILEILHG
jgi:hypothetical protein